MSELPVNQKKVDQAVERIERIFDRLGLTILEALTTAEIIVNSAQQKIDEANQTPQRMDLQ